MMMPSVALPVVSALLLQVTREDVDAHAARGRAEAGPRHAAHRRRAGGGRRPRARGAGAVSALPWFGLFSFLYGLRLLARTDTFPLFFGAPPVFWLYLAAAITYVIVVPGLLLLRAVFPAWRRHFGRAAAFVARVRGGRHPLRRRPAAARIRAGARTI